VVAAVLPCVPACRVTGVAGGAGFQSRGAGMPATTGRYLSLRCCVLKLQWTAPRRVHANEGLVRVDRVAVPHRRAEWPWVRNQHSHHSEDCQLRAGDREHRDECPNPAAFRCPTRLHRASVPAVELPHGTPTDSAPCASPACPLRPGEPPQSAVRASPVDRVDSFSYESWNQGCGDTPDFMSDRRRHSWFARVDCHSSRRAAIRPNGGLHLWPASCLFRN
jgi:hypothetical protein